MTQVTPTPTELAMLLRLMSLHLVLDDEPLALVVSSHLRVEYVTHIPEYRGTQGTLILDERQREQNLHTALDQDVTTERQRILVRVERSVPGFRTTDSAYCADPGCCP